MFCLNSLLHQYDGSLNFCDSGRFFIRILCWTLPIILALVDVNSISETGHVSIVMFKGAMSHTQA
jgi:hypothetical protein